MPGVVRCPETLSSEVAELTPSSSPGAGAKGSPEGPGPPGPPDPEVQVDDEWTRDDSDFDLVRVTFR